MRMRPPVTASSPAISRSVVDLPQPDGPRSTSICPAAASKLTSSTARVAPHHRLTCWTEIADNRPPRGCDVCVTRRCRGRSEYTLARDGDSRRGTTAHAAAIRGRSLHVCAAMFQGGSPSPLSRARDVGLATLQSNGMRDLLLLLALLTCLVAPAGAEERVIVAFGDSLTAGLGVPGRSVVSGAAGGAARAPRAMRTAWSMRASPATRPRADSAAWTGRCASSPRS